MCGRVGGVGRGLFEPIPIAYHRDLKRWSGGGALGNLVEGYLTRIASVAHWPLAMIRKVIFAAWSGMRRWWFNSDRLCLFLGGEFVEVPFPSSRADLAAGWRERVIASLVAGGRCT